LTIVGGGALLVSMVFLWEGVVFLPPPPSGDFSLTPRELGCFFVPLSWFSGVSCSSKVVELLFLPARPGGG
jgi:hypothetical protein